MQDFKIFSSHFKIYFKYFNFLLRSVKSFQVFAQSRQDIEKQCALELQDLEAWGIRIVLFQGHWHSRCSINIDMERQGMNSLLSSILMRCESLVLASPGRSQDCQTQGWQCPEARADSNATTTLNSVDGSSSNDCCLQSPHNVSQHIIFWYLLSTGPGGSMMCRKTLQTLRRRSRTWQLRRLLSEA